MNTNWTNKATKKIIQSLNDRSSLGLDNLDDDISKKEKE